MKEQKSAGKNKKTEIQSRRNNWKKRGSVKEQINSDNKIKEHKSPLKKE